MHCGRLRTLIAGIAGWIALSGPAHGQSVRQQGTNREFEDRASLEADARRAEAAGHEDDARLIRSRLVHGDFQEGDRIVVTLLGPTAFNDTLMVRSGKVLPLPRMESVELEGVLRSELTARLSSHMAKYVRDSSLRATPLVRFGILGSVRAPGYYYLPADLPISDVIMRAGGPGGDADFQHMTIRRGDETIWGPEEMRTALNDGLSLDRLHVRAGDELHVPTETHINWLTMLQIGTTVLSLAYLLTHLH